jgi:hypothetical protein
MFHPVCFTREGIVDLRAVHLFLHALFDLPVLGLMFLILISKSLGDRADNVLKVIEREREKQS